MSDDAITVTGLKEVQEKLYSYSRKVGDKVILASLRKGAAVVRKEIQSNVPVKTGKLKRAFAISRSRIHRGRIPGSMIGIYLTIRKGKNGAFYGRFLNDGYQKGKTTIPGKFFIQKAFDSKKSAAVAVIIKTAEDGATKLAKEMGIG